MGHLTRELVLINDFSCKLVVLSASTDEELAAHVLFFFCQMCTELSTKWPQGYSSHAIHFPPSAAHSVTFALSVEPQLGFDSVFAKQNEIAKRSCFDAHLYYKPINGSQITESKNDLKPMVHISSASFFFLWNTVLYGVKALNLDLAPLQELYTIKINKLQITFGNRSKFTACVFFHRRLKCSKRSKALKSIFTLIWRYLRYILHGKVL